MSGVLRRVFVASLLKRRLASALSLLSIALGVALGLAVQIIHGAALDEFGEGVRRMSGIADLQVTGPREGFGEDLYAVLALRPEVAEASPVLEIEARIPGAPAPLRILGVDLFRVAAVQPQLLPVAGRGTGPAPDRLAALREDALFLSAEAEASVFPDAGGGDSAPRRLTVQSGLQLHDLDVAGGVPGARERMGVMDIAAAQDVFARRGLLTRIDLRLAAGTTRTQAMAALSPLLPAGVVLRTVDEAATEAAGLSRAYRVNLTMLAAIALLTGGFLVFSAQWLAVVRRRREFGVLRALGLERGQLRRGLLAEGAVIGGVGGIFGVALGHGLAALAFRFAGADLGAGVFRDIVPTLHVDPLLSAAYLALGITAGTGGAWLPAREATRVPPAQALHAAGVRDAPSRPERGRAGMALSALALAGAACLLPPFGGIPLGGYVAVAGILAAAVLALPPLTAAVSRLLAGGRHPVWRLARARFVASRRQVAVAGAGVVASVAVASAMAIMVNSFRLSVDDWLTQVLPADLYLRASASSASGYLDDAALERIRSLPGVAGADPVRAVNFRLDAASPPVTLLARPVAQGWGLPLVAGTLSPPATAARPPAWIAEAIADGHRLKPGDRLTLPIGGAMHDFRVAGIWRDYARQHGAVVIERKDYLAVTGDGRINDVAIRLAAGHEADRVAAALRELLGEQRVEIARPGEIRAITLQIFDRTFLITYLMEAVAVAIGLFGIATTFAAQAASRRGEFGMLRHLGLTRRDIGRLLALEGMLTCVMGVLAGLLGGAAVSVVLIEVINRQSFHWSMDFSVPWAALAVFSVTLVLLAGWAAQLAGAHATRRSAVLAVKEDW
ncbi:ABC transporter permease [Thauera sinica]|uniref:FtsX-like permease family protein n=1 Tax=Thauera sinica TaxID=2665146 RepID=A0ABW1ATU1_9RHOO|nr:ABC transporter permease [Thauera sp. K11]ATE60010.1 ABC transporter permease [Thauera sp. K11]